MSISKKTILKFIKGDQDATAEVYLEYKNLMYFIIASYVPNKADCDDILSECFIKALEHRSDIKDPNKIKSFLSTIAKNQAINFLKRDPFVTCSDVNEVLALFGPLLTNKETIVIYLKIYFSYTWTEIVEETGIPETTARRLYESAKEKLRKELS